MATRSDIGRPATDGQGSVEVRVQGIRKSFGGGGAAALASVDLVVREGELLALLGPSGSGKTTLLRVIAGLEIPDTGQVHFGAENVTDRPVQERGIGFVFQHYALFRHLNVAENVAYGLRTRRSGRHTEATIRARVAELLALVQLDGLGQRFPAQLSGGQRQRVALARALATAPRVLLLDEPFGALDAQVRKDLRRWLRDIHRRTGQTTIFVTHDQDEALELADRVAILNSGRIEQVGSPDDIYDRPASAFVMSFVGESARLPVHVQDGLASFAGRALSIPSGSAPDGEHVLHLRPSDLQQIDPALAELVGTVHSVRRAGPARRAEIHLEPGNVPVEIEVAGRALTPGERVGFMLAGGRIFPPFS